jgi:dTDP-4-amino-4,6-dideoxygalactose transaminase
MRTDQGIDRPIPFNKPWIVGKELQYIAEAIQTGTIGGDGPFTARCSRMLEQQLGTGKVLMTPSCTAALEMAARLCGIGPGDEVILPSFTFVSTANAFVRLGAQPVFAEIREDTLNIDETAIERAITSRTRVIVPVHYAGVACEMDTIMTIAGDHGLFVVEDSAQGVGSFYKRRALGSIGHFGAFSFHATKHVICGEGGALCCNLPEIVERAEIVRDKGTNRAKFHRGEIDKYTWVDVGSSYIPSEIACAFLLAQLEATAAIKERGRKIDQIYRELLEPARSQGLLRLPFIPGYAETHHCSFHIILNSEETRNGLLAHLKQRDIGAVFHYVPLHSSPMGVRFGYKAGDLPLTESLSARILRLPSFAEITEREQERVAQLVTSYLRRSSACSGTLHSAPPIALLQEART